MTDEEKFVRSGIAEINTEFECAYKCVGSGWKFLLVELNSRAVRLWIDYGIRIRIDQVKEKFAGLRFYYNTSIDLEKNPSLYKDGKMVGWRYISESDNFETGTYADCVLPKDEKMVYSTVCAGFDGCVNMVEALSYKVCEECGATDSTVGIKRGYGSWMITRCDKCKKEKWETENA
jgi:hypothetical protein